MITSAIERSSNIKKTESESQECALGVVDVIGDVVQNRIGDNGR